MKAKNRLYQIAILVAFLLNFINGTFVQALEGLEQNQNVSNGALVGSDQEAGADNKLTVPPNQLQGIILNNKCFRQSAKPFSSFSRFGYNTNEKYFYKVKGCTYEKLTTIPDDLMTYVEVLQGEKILNPIQTLYNFFHKEKLTEENCPITSSEIASAEIECKDGYQLIDSKKGGGKGGGKGPKQLPLQCREKGHADSYVLALSWQPGFCMTKSDKTECSDSSYISGDQVSAKNFSLHGLWPNQKQCGIDYAFCDGAQEKRPFTEYEELKLNPTTISYLEQIMPSFRAGSGLERHEWNKHGTCQSLDVDDYFSLARNLVTEFNESIFMEYLRSSVKSKTDDSVTGTSFSINQFKIKIDEVLGAKVSDSFIFVCNNKGQKNTSQTPYLVEVEIHLKPTLTKDSTLKDSIDSSAKGGVRNCGSIGANVNVLSFQ